MFVCRLSVGHKGYEDVNTTMEWQSNRLQRELGRNPSAVGNCIGRK
jgi:hypothetical protein